MGNRITYTRRPDLPDLTMSNGLTDVFVSVLSLATSALARNDRERELAVWIAERDQSVARGTVGFDVGAMPWAAETFAADREFLLRAVAAAKAKTGWERLGYTPDEESVRSALDKFGTLIASFDVADAYDPYPDDPYEAPPVYRLCPRHQVYLTEHGCVIHHDAGPGLPTREPTPPCPAYEPWGGALHTRSREETAAPDAGPPLAG